MSSNGNRNLLDITSTSKVVVACGGGGVGKTSVAAAAAALAAAEQGGKVLVLTVDPARRLAGALGLDALSNTVREIPERAFMEAGLRQPKGELWAAMLDMKQSWDDLVRRHSPDSNTCDKILTNPLYDSITSRFVQSHDYIAVERLYEEYTTGNFDLIVVDTPPSRNALDFLDAPKHMADFLSSRLLKWIIIPYRSNLINIASKPFYHIADRILGSQFLTDISEFFAAFQSMYDGFRKRAVEVETLLKSKETSFIVITTLEEVPLREAETFVTELRTRQMNLRSIVLNKVLPEYLLDSAAMKLAGRLVKDPDSIAGKLALHNSGGTDADAGTGDANPHDRNATGKACAEGKSNKLKGNAAGATEATDRTSSSTLDAQDQLQESEGAVLSTVLYEIGRSFLDFHMAAENEQRQKAKLHTTGHPTIVLPRLDGDIADIKGLATLAGLVGSPV
ncbi:MAG: AAA family ATPase [Actinobacteria bacterium]|nr:AAA family ATPase [Actinomycetota bacterium]MCL5446052.1 AAA family ATPase [Actinomycetota bacterium]